MDVDGFSNDLVTFRNMDDAPRCSSTSAAMLSESAKGPSTRDGPSTLAFVAQVRRTLHAAPSTSVRYFVMKAARDAS